MLEKQLEPFPCMMLGFNAVILYCFPLPMLHSPLPLLNVIFDAFLKLYVEASLA